MPTLGILITYHNERLLIQECLESVESQSQPVDEIFLYDDGSRTPLTDLLPPRFHARIIRGEVNRGPSFGRNRLLERAGAQYVHFQDADDLLMPHWCKNVREAIEETGSDVILTELSCFGNQTEQNILGLKRVIGGEPIESFAIREEILTPAGTYRTEVVRRLGGYRESLWQSEDFDFHVRIFSAGVTAHILEDSLVNVRLRRGGRSQNRLEVFEGMLMALEQLSRELPGKLRQILAEKTAYTAAHLFKLGNRQAAYRAMELARQLGPPRYDFLRKGYGVLAKTFGQRPVEWGSLAYRMVVPYFLRKLVVQSGW